jgi:hypothetical protein
MKYVFLTIGFISLALGLIGIPFPILPTTPFLLLSALCFAKGSDKVNEWFKNTKIYKQYVGSYMEKKGMDNRQKVKILAIVTILFSIGMYFTKSLHLRIFMGLVLLAHYYFFLLHVKTLKSESNINNDSENKKADTVSNGDL